MVDEIVKAGEIIKNGGLVAFPTETVYGLGADAFNAQAVQRIYSAKGRPGDNPLILHIANKEKFPELAHNPPSYAMKLFEKFSPGALTLVVKKNPSLPNWLGGHPDRSTDTIGIRMPANPIAQAIIMFSECVVAAPSANKAGTPSPTSANHVRDDFSPEEIDLVVDGGNVTLGLESTVVDSTGEIPVILRPGSITAEMISQALGMEISEPTNIQMISNHCKNAPKSPGMKYKHYAPKAPMTIISGSPENVTAHILKECKQQEMNGNTVGVLLSSVKFPYSPENTKTLQLGNSHESAAQNLFAHLRQFDKLGVTEIYAEAVSDTGIGVAVMDRMRKAAEGRIVYV